MPADNLAMMTMADGSVVDTGNLLAGQRVCYYCMHPHPQEHVNFLPIGKHHFQWHKHPGWTWGDGEHRCEEDGACLTCGIYHPAAELARYPQKIACPGCVAHEVPEDHERVRALHAAPAPGGHAAHPAVPDLTG